MPTPRFLRGILLGTALVVSCAPPASPGQAPTLKAPAVLTMTPDTATVPAIAASNTPEETPTLPATATEAPVVALPAPGSANWQLVAEGLQNPTDMSAPRDGSARLFILEKPGRIRILQDGNLLPDPFLDITARVGSNASEQGLLGLAFDPQYAQNGRFYVNYTDPGGDTHVGSFRVSASNPNLADPNTYQELFFIEQPYGNHNGGDLDFGPDGLLYMAMGDGGSANDPLGNGQSLNTYLGKLLRIDVVDTGYTIPASNPFAIKGGLPEIWAYGLRNPWRISFDPLTGDLYIADVGQNQWEEINVVAAGTPGGLNFGWDLMEGSHPFEGADSPELVKPAAEYSHAEGCSVTGGHVYRGPTLPAWQGVYLYGDFCSGLVWGLLRSDDSFTSGLLFQTGYRISTFGQDEAGELYLADYNGAIYRLTAK